MIPRIFTEDELSIISHQICHLLKAKLTVDDMTRFDSIIKTLASMDGNMAIWFIDLVSEKLMESTENPLKPFLLLFCVVIRCPRMSQTLIEILKRRKDDFYVFYGIFGDSVRNMVENVAMLILGLENHLNHLSFLLSLTYSKHNQMQQIYQFHTGIIRNFLCFNPIVGSMTKDYVFVFKSWVEPTISFLCECRYCLPVLSINDGSKAASEIFSVYNSYRNQVISYYKDDDEMVKIQATVGERLINDPPVLNICHLQELSSMSYLPWAKMFISQLIEILIQKCQFSSALNMNRILVILLIENPEFFKDSEQLCCINPKTFSVDSKIILCDTLLMSLKICVMHKHCQTLLGHYPDFSSSNEYLIKIAKSSHSIASTCVKILKKINEKAGFYEDFDLILLHNTEKKLCQFLHGLFFVANMVLKNINDSNEDNCGKNLEESISQFSQTKQTIMDNLSVFTFYKDSLLESCIFVSRILMECALVLQNQNNCPSHFNFIANLAKEVLFSLDMAALSHNSSKMDKSKELWTSIFQKLMKSDALFNSVLFIVERDQMSDDVIHIEMLLNYYLSIETKGLHPEQILESENSVSVFEQSADIYNNLKSLWKMNSDSKDADTIISYLESNFSFLQNVFVTNFLSQIVKTKVSESQKEYLQSLAESFKSESTRKILLG